MYCYILIFLENVFKKKLSIIVYIWLVFGLVLKYYLINKYVCSRRFFLNWYWWKKERVYWFNDKVNC